MKRNYRIISNHSTSARPGGLSMSVENATIDRKKRKETNQNEGSKCGDNSKHRTSLIDIRLLGNGRGRGGSGTTSSRSFTIHSWRTTKLPLKLLGNLGELGVVLVLCEVGRILAQLRHRLHHFRILQTMKILSLI